jgi:hypothetical protein
MPRPQRIEYENENENAFYHVMNRGRERHTIFHGDEYYLCFLETLAQAQLRFKCIVDAYSVYRDTHCNKTIKHNLNQYITENSTAKNQL